MNSVISSVLPFAAPVNKPRPKFSAKLTLSQPTTIAESQFKNDRVSLNKGDMPRSLLEKLDEAMTVTGEVYAKDSEAFTAVIDVGIKGDAQNVGSGMQDATIETQVEHAMNPVTKKGPMGIMVLVSRAADYFNGTPIASARATFNALGPDPQNPGALTIKPVPELTLDASEQKLNQKAITWNNGLPAFYSNLKKRYLSLPLPNLAKTASSDTRLINSNIYVTPDMMNKKGTGHGGITAARAVQDMVALVKKYKQNFTDVAVERISANYLAPYKVSDALQFDTTLDHIDGQNAFLSARISKLDTKGQVAEGPIILAHAKIKAGTVMRPLDPSKMDAEAQQRQADAIAWSALPD